MSMWVFLKVFGDICLCYAVIGMLPKLFSVEFSLLWPVMLCASGAAMAAYVSNQGKGKCRFFALILPLATFMLADSLVEYLVLVPPVVYACAVIIRGDLALEYYSQRQMFHRCMVFLAILYGLSFLFEYVESITRPLQGALESNALLLYGVLYGFSGCLLLRELRMGMDGYGRERTLSNIQMAVVFGGAGAMLVGFMAAREKLWQWTLALLRVIWNGVVILFGFVGWLIGLLFNDEMKDLTEELETVETTAPPTSPLPTIVLSGGEQTEHTVEIGYPWWLVVLILAAMMVLLLLLLGSFRKQMTVMESEEILDDSAAPERESKTQRGTNRSKVRRYYREFLKAQRRKGVRIQSSHTSLDILEEVSEKTDKVSASQLRDIYIAARYDDSREVTSQQVQEARKAAKKAKE